MSVHAQLLFLRTSGVSPEPSGQDKADELQVNRGSRVAVQE